MKTTNEQAASILFLAGSNRNLRKDWQEQKSLSLSLGFSRSKPRFSSWKSVLKILHCCDFLEKKERFHSEICQPGTVYISSNVTTKPIQNLLVVGKWLKCTSITSLVRTANLELPHNPGTPYSCAAGCHGKHEIQQCVLPDRSTVQAPRAMAEQTAFSLCLATLRLLTHIPQYCSRQHCMQREGLQQQHFIYCFVQHKLFFLVPQ